MMRPSPKQKNTRLNLFTAVEGPTVVSTRFWFHLLRSRPLILLGGLWLGLICTAAIAYSRLMFAGAPPESRQPPPAASSSQVLERPSATGESLPSPTQTSPALSTPAPNPTDPTSAIEEPFVAAPTPQPTTIPAWSLGLLVSLCAVGCFLMARQATASPRPRKAQPEGTGMKVPPKKLRRPSSPSGRSTGRSIAPKVAGASSAPKRLQPYSPERDHVVVPVRPDIQVAGRSAVPIRPEAVVAPPGNPVVASAPLSDPSKAISPKVTVMPDGEPHSLDWPDGSLAHSLDIRQRRSLSSFL